MATLWNSLQRQKFAANNQYIALEESGTTQGQVQKGKQRTSIWRDGYHMGVLGGMAAAVFVLLLNIGLMIGARANQEFEDGYGVLQEGDCSATKRLDTWLHLLINILSTVLLGASNYSMQCLTAPTRDEINAAHLQGRWLEIGVPSMRNLVSISILRKILWTLLLFSSLPLHLLYNSVVFSSTSSAEWSASAVSKDFLTGAAYPVDHEATTLTNGHSIAEMLDTFRSNSSSLVRLDNEACLNAYSPPLQSAWSSVLLVTSQINKNGSYLNETIQTYLGESQSLPFCYFLPQDDLAACDQKGFIDPNNWRINVNGNPQVAYCMAFPAQEHCQVRFSVNLMIVVLICNCIKIACFGFIAYRADARPLVTLGDAIASFLERPDVTTEARCLTSKSGFGTKAPWTAHPTKAKRCRPRWFASATPGRWIVTTVLCTGTLIAATVLLVNGVKSYSHDTSKSPFDTGFGAPDVQLTLGFSSLEGKVVANILIANSPQLLLSCLYFAYNGLWTYMLVSQEWLSYAQEKKGLRVTSPRGTQRSTYTLQLPYRYGIPLMIMSGLLHWLVSQSIYLLDIDAYDFYNEINTADSLIICGFSPQAILVTIIVGSVALIFGLANGLRRHPATSMPMATSNSAVISAACHPPPNDDDAYLKEIQWGVCSRDMGNALDVYYKHGMSWSKEPMQRAQKDVAIEVGHCSFSSLPVTPPREGSLYAGESSHFRRTKGEPLS